MNTSSFEKQFKRVSMILAGIILIISSYFFFTSNDSANLFAFSDKSKPETRIVTIDSKDWTEITFGIPSTQQEPSWGAIGDNVPFFVRVNGGEKEGGYEYSVPRQRDWKKSGWQPPYFPNTLVKVSFRLAPCELTQAKVACTVR